MDTKKIFSYLLAGIGLIPSVSAASVGEDIAKIFQDILGFIFIDFTWTGSNFFYIKFFIWILVFAILYFSATRIPHLKDSGRGVLITIPLVLSIISVVLISDDVVKTIAESYGFFVAFVLLGAPIVGIVYIMKGFNEERMGRASFVLKGILLILMSTLIHNMMVAVDEFKIDYKRLDTFIYLVASFAFLIGLWYLLRALLYGQGQRMATAAGAGGFWDNFFGPQQQPTPAGGAGAAPGAQPTPYPAHLRTTFLNHMHQINTNINAQFSAMTTAGTAHLTQVNAAGAGMVPTGWSVSIATRLPKPPATTRAEYTNPRDRIINQLYPQFLRIHQRLINDPHFDRLNRSDTNYWNRMMTNNYDLLRRFVRETGRYEGLIDYS